MTPQNKIIQAPKKAIGPIKNGILPPSLQSMGVRPEGEHDFNRYIMRAQLSRIKQNIQTWRDGVTEAENPWWPWRVKMQQLFIDTVLNGHVAACMKRRADLTMMKDFVICDENGKEDKVWTEAFRSKWFYEILGHIVDAPLYGYSLINWPSIKDGIPQGVQIVRRWHVSPDRYNVGTYVYSTEGIDFRSDDMAPFCLYVSTPSQTGASPCGFGLLYKVAMLEIFCRNTLAFNGDFVERYSQPYRVGRTDKTAGSERDVFEDAIKNMGNSNYAILDNNDVIEFLETSLGGTGYKGYESLEARCEKKISKLLLGHADAMDSTPGKLGSGQGGDESPAQAAMNTIGSEQNRMVQFVINDDFLPKMRENGMAIPDNLRLKFLNDDEEEEAKNRQNDQNVKIGNFLTSLSTAGFEADEKWVSEQSGAKIVKKEVPEPLDTEPIQADPGAKPLPENVQAKLKKLYAK